MILDSRIKEGKRPLTCFDTAQAQNFVGKKCYLTNDISIFSDLDSFKDTEGCSDAPYVGVIDWLTNINKELSKVFDTTFLRWKFCIPCEWVKPKELEKKYRPYTLAEWIDKHEIGDVIHYRSKSGEIELRQMYVGTRHSQGIKNIIVKITLGEVSHTLDYLFKDYEIEVNGEWLPFGVIDE